MSWCVDALIGSLWSEPPLREGRWCDKQIWCIRTKLNEYGRSTNKGHILRRGRSCTKSAKMIFRQGLCQGSDSGRFHWRETYFETGFATGQWTSPANRTTPIFSLRMMIGILNNMILMRIRQCARVTIKTTRRSQRCRRWFCRKSSNLKMTVSDWMEGRRIGNLIPSCPSIRIVSTKTRQGLIRQILKSSRI